MASSAVTAKQVEPTLYMRSMRPVDLVHLAKQCLGDENLEL